MKKFFAKTFTAVFILGLLAIPVSTTKGAELIGTKTETPMSAENQALITRLNEIDAMDKKTLTRVEKKELRREVKSIKEQLATGGVYISVGAIIIILLLLIILL